MADESRLHQRFESLFPHVVEHAGSDVHVTVDTTADGFHAADNRPGIPLDDRDRVFENGYTSEGDGTGFGSGIVQQIVTGRNWEILVTESADGGARFEITGTDFDE